MSLYPVYPAVLDQGEFAMLRFSLEAQAAIHFEISTLLGLRQPLRQAACDLHGERGAALFDAPLSVDPLALRRHQKPSPGFVLQPGLAGCGGLLEGDHLEIDCLFLGTAVHSISAFIGIVQHLGRRGLVRNAGLLELAEVRSLGADGCWRRLWSLAQPDKHPAPDLLNLGHWVDQHWSNQSSVALEVVTPMRLLAGGRILRSPRFDQVFPFLLRRVTSMLNTYCDLDSVEDPALLIQTARCVTASWTGLRWVDWRETGSAGALGGLLGTLRIFGPELDDLLWVLRLATLFGIGKGAAYGAGRCRLHGTE